MAQASPTGRTAVTPHRLPGPNCKRTSREERHMTREVVCRECGTLFKAKKSTSKYCSRQCQHESMDTKTTSVCQHCGKQFRARNDRNTYCSRECAFEARKAKPKSKKEAPEHTCCICGAVFSSSHSGAKCCSDECRAEYARRKHHEYATARKQAKPRSCRECGKEFVPEYGNKRRVFCSAACLGRWQNRMKDRTMTNARRRARLRGAKVELFKHGDIFERDGWVCGICGEPIDPMLKHPHPMSVSLDHIIALCNGGSHTAENVQAAHMICNAFKGAVDALDMAS